MIPSWWRASCRGEWRQPEMADVFISYASADPAPPLALEAALEGAGLARRLASAQLRLADAAEQTIEVGDVQYILWQCEALAEALAEGDPVLYARMVGCVDAERKREGIAIQSDGHNHNQQILQTARSRVSGTQWAAAVEQGSNESIIDLFRHMAAEPLIIESPETQSGSRAQAAHDRGRTDRAARVERSD